MLTPQPSLESCTVHLMHVALHTSLCSEDQMKDHTVTCVLWEGWWEALCGPMSFLTPVCNLALLRQEDAASGFWMLYHKLSAVLLNTLAAIAGSSATFGVVCALIVSWAIAGIFVHDNDIWQISMQVAIAFCCAVLL